MTRHYRKSKGEEIGGGKEKKGRRKIRILFPTSSGGHLTEILQLKRLFEDYEYLIVTEDILLNKQILADYNYTLIKPNGKNRNLEFWKNFFLNWMLAFKITLRFKPDVIVTTGSHTAVPFCYIGKLFKSKVIFILSFCRVDTKAKSADLVYPISDLFFVQWPQMKNVYKGSTFVGPIF